MKARTVKSIALHLTFVATVTAILEIASRLGWLNPMMYGRPSAIVQFLWMNAANGKLWSDLFWTMAGTLLSFGIGSVVAILTGLAFVSWPKVERFLEPYFSAINAMPRIALAPLFVIWFGIGLGSKIAVGASVAFFIVLSSTVAGIRGVSQDHKTLCATLGASGPAIFWTITLPGAVPVLFAGLRLALIYSLLSVIGAEMIASEHGVGQSLMYLGSTFDVNGVMALLLVLALLGTLIVRLMSWLEMRLLAWQ